MTNAVNIATQFIKKWEGCRLKAYQDQVGVWTIGYGQTGSNVVEGLEIDQATADHWLEGRVMLLETEIAKHLEVSLADEEMAALISFSYNEGLHALLMSTLFRMINNNQYTIEEEIAEMLKWDIAGGLHNVGLRNRREAEAILFRQGYEVNYVES